MYSWRILSSELICCESGRSSLTFQRWYTKETMHNTDLDVNIHSYSYHCSHSWSGRKSSKVCSDHAYALAKKENILSVCEVHAVINNCNFQFHFPSTILQNPFLMLLKSAEIISKEKTVFTVVLDLRIDKIVIRRVFCNHFANNNASHPQMLVCWHFFIYFSPSLQHGNLLLCNPIYISVFQRHPSISCPTRMCAFYPSLLCALRVLTLTTLGEVVLKQVSSVYNEFVS